MFIIHVRTKLSKVGTNTCNLVLSKISLLQIFAKGKTLSVTDQSRLKGKALSVTDVTDFLDICINVTDVTDFFEKSKVTYKIS